MKARNHLQALEIEEAAEGRADPKARLHLAGCEMCRARVARAAKWERVLRAVLRVEPAPGLAAQIRAAVAGSATKRRLKTHEYLTGAAAALAALLALALVYQAGIELQVGGALNFLSFYVRQPDALINYPGDALAALVEVLPLAQMLMTLTVVAIAVLLAQRFRGVIDAVPAQRLGRHA